MKKRHISKEIVQQAALEKDIDTIAAYLYSTAKFWKGNKGIQCDIESMDDIFQDAVIRVCKQLKLGKYSPEHGLFTSWAGTIIRNQFINAYRSDKKKNTFSYDNNEQLQVNITNRFSTTEEDNQEANIIIEQDAKLHKMLNALNNREQLLVRERYFNKKSFSQLSIELDEKEVTLRTRMHNIKNKMRHFQ